MIIPTVEYTITAAGLTQLIDLDGLYQEFWFRTTVAPITLAGNVSIAPDPGDTPTTDVIVIRCNWRMVLNGNTVTVFGVALDQEMCLNDLRIECKYDPTASAWRVTVLEDVSTIPFGVPGVTTTNLGAAGGTINLVSGIDDKHQRFISTGTPILLAGWTIQGSGTPTEGSEFFVYLDGTWTTAGGNNITLGSVTLTALEAASGLIMGHFIYSGSAWLSYVWSRANNNDTFRVMASSGDTSPAYLDSKVKNSIEVDADDLQLVNDQAPVAGTLYAVNGAGTLGWINWTTIGGGLWEAGIGTTAIQTPNGTTGCAANGDYSIASGRNCTADGNYSIAMGEDNTASGNHGVALGDTCTASGSESVAMGFTCTASASESVAIGFTCTASGTTALAMGAVTTASGDYSTALGNSTVASGDYSTALGQASVASASNSVSMGGSTASGIYSAALNNSNASGAFSLSAGQESVAHLHASRSFASDSFSIPGDCEKLDLFLKKATTNAVAASMLQGDSLTAGVAIPTDSLVMFRCYYTALQTGGIAGTAGDGFAQVVEFAVQNLAGVLTLYTANQVTTAGITTVAGNIVKYDSFVLGALAPAIAPAISGTDILFNVTGEANKDINHGLYVQAWIMGFNNFVI